MARIRPGFRLRRGQNLADLTDPPAARGALGLGSAAVQDDTRYAHRGNNLGDLGDAPTARNNLGLGSAAVQNDSRYLRQDTSGSIAGGLSVESSHRVKADGNRHVWFESLDGTEQGLIWHDDANGKLRMRLKNGGAGALAELAMEGDGDIRAINGRFAGPADGLTSLPTGPVAAATAGVRLGEVGSYAFLKNKSAGDHNPGNTESGGNLQYAANTAGASTTSISGTWLCMGRALVDQATVYLRIS